MESVKWYQLDTEPVMQKLGSSMEGLNEKEIIKRQEIYGFNELIEKNKNSVLKMLLEQFTDILVLILLAAAVISGILGEISDALVIMVVVVLNAVLGVIQEDKAEKSLAALKKLSSPTAVVKREGRVIEVPAKALVPGDIILLDAGKLIPADCRLLTSSNLKVEESSLTGESVPVEKSACMIPADNVGIGDRRNMVYMSSMVTYGRGTAIVTGTGMNTEIGKIAAMIQQEDKNLTPLQVKLEGLGRWLGIVSVGICILMFFIGILEGRQYLEMFMTSVSLAVAAIPEGLPAVVTIVLAIGVQRMIKRNAIIRKLPAVETLGCATVICSDKTGTLTQNKMTVMKAYVYDVMLEDGDLKESSDFDLLLRILTLCNDTHVTIKEQKAVYVGDPTETALVEYAAKYGVDKLEIGKVNKRLGEVPFDSERKLMTTINTFGDGIKALIKGAPDVLLKRCRYILDSGTLRELGSNDIEKIKQANEEMADSALRVLGGAYRDFAALPDDVNSENIEQELVFVGLIGMIDPPREEAREAVRICKLAGIRPVMITGDHKVTAVAIARDLKILDENHEALSGAELDEIDDEELQKSIKEYSVYARVSPQHKVRIVKAWQSGGQVVAMTGDGVNDAPALKRADIGAAMGITGTDVAKGAADMVLTDDNFATIVAAVEEGRTIFANIRKTIKYLLSCNIGEIVTLFTAIMLGWKEPLLPIHILWVNLVTDTLPALALGLDPKELGIMNQKPRDPKSGMFDKGLGLRIFIEGVIIGGLSLLAYNIGLNYNLEIARTMTFTVLSLSQLFHAYNVRSDINSIFTTGIFTNKYLTGATVLSSVLQLSVLFVPFLRNIFKVSMLDAGHWIIVLGLSIAPVLLVEIMKGLRRVFKR